MRQVPVIIYGWHAAICCAAPILLFGFLTLFNTGFRNFLWIWQEFGNRSKGITNSERTGDWEGCMTTIGAFLVIAGIILLILIAAGLGIWVGNEAKSDTFPGF
jgi:hypothetical protein